MEKNIVARLRKFNSAINKADKKKRESEVKALLATLKIRARATVLYWLGTDSVPDYHHEALDKFLTGKGY